MNLRVKDIELWELCMMHPPLHQHSQALLLQPAIPHTDVSQGLVCAGLQAAATALSLLHQPGSYI